VSLLEPRSGGVATSGRTMKAWQVVKAGEPAEALSLTDVPVPAPGEGQVLVGAWATCLGFADVLLARGRHPDQPDGPFTPGAEICGEIVAVGDGVARGRLGDRVIGRTLLPHGGLAAYSIARDVDMLAAPKAFDDPTAAAFHSAYQVGRPVPAGRAAGR
jgi:NADPH2:quinone reductase